MKRDQILLLFAVLFACLFTKLPSSAAQNPEAVVETPMRKSGQNHEGAFVKTQVAEGLCHYLFEGYDGVTDAMQTVNVLRVDLDNEKYKVVFDWGTDSTSA